MIEVKLLRVRGGFLEVVDEGAMAAPPDELQAPTETHPTEAPVRKPEIDFEGRVVVRSELYHRAKALERIARHFRIVDSRYQAELKNGMTAAKAYRLAWMTIRDMKKEGEMPDEPWVDELVADMKERAKVLGAAGNQSGDLGDGTSGGVDGEEPWSGP